MEMEHKLQLSSTSVNEQDDSTSTPENDASSPLSLSGNEMMMPADHEPSPKISKRSIQKRVISVPIVDADGSRSKGEVLCPPMDSWTWRKYGQKPIKGSPYPRGYYRCSSSKGCPARKQVERSRKDSTMLSITYSFEHSHPPLPTTTRHHLHSPNATTPNYNLPAEESAIFSNQQKFGAGDSSFSEFIGDSCWFSDMGSTTFDTQMFAGQTCMDADIALMLPIGEEDQTLFGDLGELSECSVVFQRCRLDTTYMLEG